MVLQLPGRATLVDSFDTRVSPIGKLWQISIDEGYMTDLSISKGECHGIIIFSFSSVRDDQRWS